MMSVWFKLFRKAISGCPKEGTKKTTKVFTQNGKITKEVEQYGGQAG